MLKMGNFYGGFPLLMRVPVDSKPPRLRAGSYESAQRKKECGKSAVKTGHSCRLFHHCSRARQLETSDYREKLGKHLP